jgi:hypothetical protein
VAEDRGVADAVGQHAGGLDVADIEGTLQPALAMIERARL